MAQSPAGLAVLRPEPVAVESQAALQEALAAACAQLAAATLADAAALRRWPTRLVVTPLLAQGGERAPSVTSRRFPAAADAQSLAASLLALARPLLRGALAKLPPGCLVARLLVLAMKPEATTDAPAEQPPPFEPLPSPPSPHGAYLVDARALLRGLASGAVTPQEARAELAAGRARDEAGRAERAHKRARLAAEAAAAE